MVLILAALLVASVDADQAFKMLSEAGGLVMRQSDPASLARQRKLLIDLCSCSEPVVSEVCERQDRLGDSDPAEFIHLYLVGKVWFTLMYQRFPKTKVLSDDEYQRYIYPLVVRHKGTDTADLPWVYQAGKGWQLLPYGWRITGGGEFSLVPLHQALSKFPRRDF